GLSDNTIQQTVNQTIYNATVGLMQYQHAKQDVSVFANMAGTYEIKTNERNVLSLVLSNYDIAPNHANGLTILDSLTFDLTTGKQCELHDLFKPGSDYINLLSKLVKQQISERDIPVLDPFETIQPDQDVYIADKTIVLF